MVLLPTWDAYRPTDVALLPTGVAEVFAAAVRFTTARAEPPSLSAEIPGLLEDMLNLAVRAASAPVPSAAITRVDVKEVFRHVEPPASVAAEGLTAVVVAVGNQSFVMLLVDR